MSYEILYDNPDEQIFERLLKIRNIEEDVNNFLNPSFSNSWIDPYQLNDFDVAIKRIMKAISNNEKIIVFGDYDVDGITSTYLIYTFVTKFLGYKKISIRLPNRLKDWYWIKDHHLDKMKEVWVSVVITVDNWITSIQEAEYAKSIWLDLIITDHHKALDTIPSAFAVVNPQISPNYWFKWIAGVWVAFKIVSWLMSLYIKDSQKKQEIIQYLMPIVAIWTVADCVPLLWENRLFVKMWLDYINTWKNIPQSIRNFIKYLNIKNKLEAFHIWFMIWPRINAWGRMQSPYDSLNCLLFTGDKQLQHLDALEKLNNNRRQTQEETYKEAEKLIDKEKNVLIAASSNLHEGIVGIVAGRITEKYNKPSVIINIKEDEWIAVGSLRWPEYFSVIDMLHEAGNYLERYGWHKQAWWMTLKIDNISKVKEIFEEYCQKHVKTEDVKKKLLVDTILYPWEVKSWNLNDIEKLGPYWEANPEPLFLLDEIIFNNVEKVGKTGKGHLKAHASLKWIQFPVMFWWKWEELDYVQLKNPSKLVGKVKKDNYNGWFFVDGSEVYTS